VSCGSCVARTTIVMVEQSARLALSASNRAYVLATGAVVAEDPAATLLQGETARAGYLGGAAAR
jgi:branched-chain amino acid transport system ATP-binding protein